MRHFTLLAIIGFLVGCTVVLKAENTAIYMPSSPLLDLTDRDTTVSKVGAKNDNDGKKKSSTKEDAVEETETVDIVITLTPKQQKAYEESNIPSEEELDVIEIGIITPRTRYEQPSEDTEETMIRKIDEETGEEYFIRKNHAPSQFKQLQNKRKYKRRASKLEAKGFDTTT